LETNKSQKIEVGDIIIGNMYKDIGYIYKIDNWYMFIKWIIYNYKKQDKYFINTVNNNIKEKYWKLIKVKK